MFLKKGCFRRHRTEIKHRCNLNPHDISMNYYKIYKDLIRHRQLDPVHPGVCYCELHHVVPRSCGGKDYGDNLVYLTAREHYIAHCLLWKMFKHDNTEIRLNAMRNAVRILFHARGHGMNNIMRRTRYFRCNHYLYSRIQNGTSYWGKKYHADLFSTV